MVEWQNKIKRMTVKKKLFDDLTESVEQAGRIKRGRVTAQDARNIMKSIDFAMVEIYTEIRDAAAWGADFARLPLLESGLQKKVEKRLVKDGYKIDRGEYEFFVKW
jgi:hypothetical protein